MCVHRYQSIVRFKTLTEKRNSLFHDNAISLNKKRLATLFIRYESHEIETESNCLSPKNDMIFKLKQHDLSYLDYQEQHIQDWSSITI